MMLRHLAACLTLGSARSAYTVESAQVNFDQDLANVHEPSSQTIAFYDQSDSIFDLDDFEVDLSPRNRDSRQASEYEGSGFSTNYEAFVVVSNADPASPLSSWSEELLDNTSTLYQEAVNEAVAIINNFMAQVVQSLGLSEYQIVILGFTNNDSSQANRKKRSTSSQGVGIRFEIVFDNAEVATTSHEVSATSVEASIDSAIADDSDSTSYDLNLDHVIGSAATTLAPFTCPECWIEQEGKCVPDLSKMRLTCGPDSMQLQVEKCIMGYTYLNLLSLNQAQCGSITEFQENSIDYYKADIALDECSTSMEISSDLIIFRNNLLGGYDDSSLISSVDRNNIEFSCKYATEYDDIGDMTQVQSSIQEGETDNLGQLGFSLKIFTDHSFTDEASFSAMFYVGSKLYFGIEISQEIEGLAFSVMDCVVKNKEHGLEYGIFNNKCENKRVKFRVFDNYDSKLTKFSYRVFEFRQAKAQSLHLSCNVLVCDGNDAESRCAAEAACGGRNRRSAATELESGQKVLRVSRDFLLTAEE